MQVGKICERPAVCIGVGASLVEAVQRLCTARVGALVVTRSLAGRQIVSGILTDRDILRAQLQGTADLAQLSVEDAMTRDPLLVSVNEDVVPALDQLLTRGVRRAPLVDARGEARGLLSTDDLLLHFAKQLGDMAAAVDTHSVLQGRYGTAGPAAAQASQAG